MHGDHSLVRFCGVAGVVAGKTTVHDEDIHQPQSAQQRQDHVPDSESGWLGPDSQVDLQRLEGRSGPLRTRSAGLSALKLAADE